MKKLILCIIISILCLACASKSGTLINKYPTFSLAYVINEHYPVRIVTGDLLGERYAQAQVKINEKWIRVKIKSEITDTDNVLGYIVIGTPDQRFEKVKIYSLTDFFKNF